MTKFGLKHHCPILVCHDKRSLIAHTSMSFECNDIKYDFVWIWRNAVFQTDMFLLPSSLPFFTLLDSLSPPTLELITRCQGMFWRKMEGKSNLFPCLVNRQDVFCYLCLERRKKALHIASMKRLFRFRVWFCLSFLLTTRESRGVSSTFWEREELCSETFEAVIESQKSHQFTFNTKENDSMSSKSYFLRLLFSILVSIFWLEAEASWYHVLLTRDRSFFTLSSMSLFSTRITFDTLRVSVTYTWQGFSLSCRGHAVCHEKQLKVCSLWVYQQSFVRRLITLTESHEQHCFGELLLLWLSKAFV